ncbi:MAG: trypsin-like peptidase domain-containing protein [Chloroflexota bacterium]|nr:trypsin-like peptidase domain-containing protein [Chloroflexota bacterium]
MIETLVRPVAIHPAVAAADIVERVLPSVVLVYHQRGNGAGVVWRADGQIVTNSHVAHEDRADVVLADGRRFTGIVAARHPDRDLAIIKIAADELPAVEVGDSSTVRPGQLAIALGHPVGYRNAASIGIIVAAGQAATDQGPQTGDYLQTDVALLPGNSGGPLIDAHGQVIGINTMVNGRLSLAIPSQAVERFVASGGTARPNAFIGIDGQVVVLRRNDFTAGFLISDVGEGTPADRAGLIVGDVVVAFGDVLVSGTDSISEALGRLTAGAAVEARVLRGGEPRDFMVVPTERA